MYIYIYIYIYTHTHIYIRQYLLVDTLSAGFGIFVGFADNGKKMQNIVLSLK